MSLYALIFLACTGPDEPILQAIPDQNILQDHASPTEILAQKERKVYQKPEHIFVDVMFLGGRMLSDSQGLIAEQLGNLQQNYELPMGQGLRYEYDKGNIQVLDEAIYLIEIPLPEPIRRSEALQLLGFPEQVDKYIITHREYILENSWDFRRIRMKRDSKENELVTHFSAWKFNPIDR